MQDQGMVIVQTPPTRPDKLRRRTLGRRNLTRCWRPAQLHKEAICCVAKGTLTFIHPSTVSLPPSAFEIRSPGSKGTDHGHAYRRSRTGRRKHRTGR
jgi:hypothetical protein